METQTLQERVASRRDKLSALAKTARGEQQECGRDSETNQQHSSDPMNWNKGWGKYGKT